MSIIREIAEGDQYVGVDERPMYALDVSKWGSSPTSARVAITILDGQGKQVGRLNG